MKQQLATSNYLGRRYTFYLSNFGLPNDSFYHYQVYSPGTTDDLEPLFSLKKLGERMRPGVQGFEQERDLLSFILGSNEDEVLNKRSIEYIKNVTRMSDISVVVNGTDFPGIQMTEGKMAQKCLICGLRDSIRWKNYRFLPGRKIDVLWTSDEFVVFEFKGDDKLIWLEPVGVYKNTDYLMENPLPVNLKTIICDGLKWEKNKMSEINQAIKRIEWNSFDSKFHFKR